MSITIKRVIITAALAVVAFVACGEPAEPAGFLWVTKKEIPDEYRTFRLCAVGPRGVYGIAEMQDGSDRVIVYDGSNFATAYESSQNNSLTDLAFWNDVGFLSGRKEISLGDGARVSEPVFLRYETGEWSEIPTKGEFYSFDHLTPVGPDECWMVGEVNVGESVHYRVIKYDHGLFKEYLRFDLFGVAESVYCAATNTLFVREEFANDVWITNDGGASWRRETPSAPGYEITGEPNGAVAGDAVYFVTYAAVADDGFNIVLKMTGAPGEGVYEISYMGRAAPGTLNLSHAAFRNPSDGVAIAEAGTSIFFNGQTWTREMVSPYYNFDVFSLIADPRGGYWCIHKDSEHANNELIWHP